MPLSDFFNVKLNGQVLLQLEDYSLTTSPIVKDAQGRVGTTVTLEGEGYIENADATAFATALQTAASSFSFSGGTIEIIGLGGVTELLLAPVDFLNGGPHASFEILGKPDSGLRRQVKFKATGENAPKNGGQPTELSYKVETSTRPDRLRQITRSGELAGAGISAYMEAVLKPLILATYPAGQWIPSYKLDRNFKDDRGTYSFTFIELRDALPAAGNSQVVDGELTMHVDRDEQMRKVTTKTADMVVIGDAIAIATSLRPRPPAIVLRESLEYTSFKENRLRVSFTTLEGANGNQLLDWGQSFTANYDNNPVAVESYPGTFADYYYKPRSGNLYTQAGRAVGAGKYPKEPDPVLPLFSDKIEVTYKQLNQVEYETTWRYVLISDKFIETTAIYLAQFERPSNPLFK
jgi:hypothetical protein